MAARPLTYLPVHLLLVLTGSAPAPGAQEEPQGADATPLRASAESLVVAGATVTL
ncbi:MAG: hypothetical protein L0Y66_19780 [Myxococcaceae bacterium]|nr:hypothetical protein [Myxococcaceae bacterium]